jgi:choline dehydrogenase-like flavoprotein
MDSDINAGLYNNTTKKSQILEILPLLLRPRSRGYIKLKSIDPYEAPVIVPNYFDDSHDVQVLVRYIIFLAIICEFSINS